MSGQFELNFTEGNNTDENGVNEKPRQIVESIYFSITCYIFIVVSSYELRSCVQKFRGKQADLRSHTLSVYNLVMRLSAYIGSVLMLILRLIAIVRVYNLPLSDVNCDFTVRGKPILWSCVTFCVYAMLWCRQRVVYQIKVIQHVTNRCTRGLSLCVALIFVPAHIVHTVLLVMSQKGMNVDGRCVEIPLLQKSQLLLMTTISFTLVVTQCILLVLLGHPLILHTRMSSAANPSSTLLPMLKRTFILTLVCSITDAFGPIGISIAKDVLSFKFYFFGISLIVDVICVNLNFKDWRQRLLPMFSCTDPRNSSPSKFTNSTTAGCSVSHISSHGVTNKAMDPICK